jgi:dynein heavy chain
MFSALINCTSIDWFHEWPEDALVGVAKRFLNEVTILPNEDLRDQLAKHMAFVHCSIGEANIRMRVQQRRNNYTTPTSFLELIKFYIAVLEDKTTKLSDTIERLSNGLNIMNSTTEKVAQLQKLLEVKMVEVEIEKTATGKLIAEVEVQSADA